jgi:hypothetical protein
VLLAGRWLDWNEFRRVTSMAVQGPILLVAGDDSAVRPSAFVAALTIDGSPLWEHVYALGERSPDLLLRSIAASRDGVVMAGSTSDALNLGSRRVGKKAQQTAFLAELSATGELIWTDEWPMPQGGIRAIAVDRDGDLYLTGHFMVPFEIAGHRIEPAPVSGCVSSFVARFTRTGDRSHGRGL